MAIQKTTKFSATMFTGTGNPNQLPWQWPNKVGDLYVDSTNKQLFFAVAVSPPVAGTSNMWGTCGTAGA